MGWNDPANMRVVERIQRNTVNQIHSNLTVEKEDHVEATASKLSGKLGKKLLPKIGYGRTRGGGGGGGGGGSGAKINNVDFSVLSKSISGSELTLEYELKLTQGKKTAEYTVLVESEGGLIDLITQVSSTKLHRSALNPFSLQPKPKKSFQISPAVVPQTKYRMNSSLFRCAMTVVPMLDLKSFHKFRPL